MTHVLVTTPLAPISERISSHRAAQGVIYADQIASAGYDVTVNFGGKVEDYNKFDIVAVYHGNDWGGTVNMFGGVKNFGAIDQIARLSQFKGTVWSLAIDFPGYTDMIKPRVDKEPASHPDWKNVDWKNLQKIEKKATLVNPNNLVNGTKLAAGDSHGISMYRPGWKVNSVPYKTLHGALSMGLESFLLDKDAEYSELEFYFGNIDIRHHLLRRDDPEKATQELVEEYVNQAFRLGKTVRLWEPLPIENESRKLPKTGYYKGTPFYGSWNERNDIRTLFIRHLERCCSGKVSVFSWTAGLINDAGELDFEHMEKPQSVHLSRAAYPYWQGSNWNV